MLVGVSNNNNNNRRLVTLAEHTSDHCRQTNSSTEEKGELFGVSGLLLLSLLPIPTRADQPLSAAQELNDIAESCSCAPQMPYGMHDRRERE